ncbi:hypothetical protein D3C87_871110 [compost metagenome]
MKAPLLLLGLHLEGRILGASKLGQEAREAHPGGIEDLGGMLACQGQELAQQLGDGRVRRAGLRRASSKEERTVSELRLEPKFFDQAALTHPCRRYEGPGAVRKLTRVEAREGFGPSDQRWAEEISGSLRSFFSQRQQELGGVAGAARGILGEELRQQVAQVLGQGGVERGNGLAEVRPQHGGGGLRLEGERARSELVKHDAERVEVAAGIDRGALGHFGGHVRERAADRAADPAGPLHEPEVHELDPAIRHHAQVFGLDVAVDEALGVNVAEGASGLDGDVPDLLGREGEGLIEGLAFDDFHGEVGRAVVEAAVIVGLHQVGMVEAGHQPELMLEMLETLRRERIARHFEGDLAIGGAILGQVDASHAPFPEEANDVVAVGNLVHGVSPARLSRAAATARRVGWSPLPC